MHEISDGWPVRLLTYEPRSSAQNRLKPLGQVLRARGPQTVAVIDTRVNKSAKHAVNGWRQWRGNDGWSWSAGDGRSRRRRSDQVVDLWSALSQIRWGSAKEWYQIINVIKSKNLQFTEGRINTFNIQEVLLSKSIEFPGGRDSDPESLREPNGLFDFLMAKKRMESWKVPNVGCHLSRHVGRFSSTSSCSDIRHPGCRSRTCGASPTQSIRRHRSNLRFCSRGHRNSGPYQRGGHVLLMWNQRTNEGCLRWPYRNGLFYFRECLWFTDTLWNKKTVSVGTVITNTIALHGTFVTEEFDD